MAATIELEVAIRQYATILIDTCVLIDAVSGKETALLRVPRGARRIPTVVEWEFLRHSTGPRTDLIKRRQWLRNQGLQAVSMNKDTDATLRSLLLHGGAPGPFADALIAAEAIRLGCPLVTSNTKHFLAVQHLMLVGAATQ